MRRPRKDSDDDTDDNVKRRRQWRGDGDRISGDNPHFAGQQRRSEPYSVPHSSSSHKVKREIDEDKKHDPSRNSEPEAPTVKKIEPNYEPSGILNEETNMKNGVMVKFTVPFEARSPKLKWKLIVFKSSAQEGQCIRIDYQKWFLIGKDLRVVDIPMVHPTISKQHAAICHQLTDSGEIKPFLYDLGSTNGTFLNGKRLEAMREYELRPEDIMTFAKSTREYVLLHDDLAQSIEVPLEEVMSRNLLKERKEKARSARKGRYW